MSHPYATPATSTSATAPSSSTAASRPQVAQTPAAVLHGRTTANLPPPIRRLRSSAAHNVTYQHQPVPAEYVTPSPAVATVECQDAQPASDVDDPTDEAVAVWAAAFPPDFLARRMITLERKLHLDRAIRDAAQVGGVMAVISPETYATTDAGQAVIAAHKEELRRWLADCQALFGDQGQ